MDEPNLEQSSTCCREDAEGPATIGGFKVCTNGLVGYRDYHGRRPREAVSRAQVEIVKEFLSQCRRTRWARKLLSPVSSTLKHQVEKWAGKYISTGAAIVAALELGIVCVPYCEGARDALIGVRMDDVEKLLAERPAKSDPEPPLPDPSYWKEIAKKLGIDLGNKAEMDDVEKLLAERPAKSDPEPPLPDPSFWREIARELGIDLGNEVEEG